MDALGRYILSVISAGLIAGIISGMIPHKKATGGLIRMLCGLFLAFVVMKPVSKLNYDIVLDFSREHLGTGNSLAAQGELLAKEGRCAIIKEKTEAYIVDKAAAFQADLNVEVELSGEESCVPESVILKGSVSPYTKQKLETVIETELGIPKENQQWLS